MESFFFKSDQTVPPSPAADGIFRRGEQIILILENIGTFKESNGEHRYYSQFSIETPEGKDVFSIKGDVGSIVKERLPNGILELYNITVNPEMIGIKAGKYVFKATIYDKIGGGKASVSKGFTIQQNDVLKSMSTPPTSVDMEATDKKFINGSISVKGKSISIKHAYSILLFF